MSGLRGTAHPSSKLTEDRVREIRRLLKAGQSLAELAKRFGVSRTAIRNIGNGWLIEGCQQRMVDSVRFSPSPPNVAA